MSYPKGRFQFALSPKIRSAYWKPEIYVQEMKILSTDRGDFDSIITYLHGYKNVGHILR